MRMSVLEKLREECREEKCIRKRCVCVCIGVRGKSVCECVGGIVRRA